MPRGTRHEIVGLLLMDGPDLVLAVGDGGIWRLDPGWRAAWRAKALVGQRVRIIGVRDDFDLLSVETIERA